MLTSHFLGINWASINSSCLGQSYFIKCTNTSLWWKWMIILINLICTQMTTSKPEKSARARGRRSKKEGWLFVLSEMGRKSLICLRLDSEPRPRRSRPEVARPNSSAQQNAPNESFQTLAGLYEMMRCSALAAPRTKRAGGGGGACLDRAGA